MADEIKSISRQQAARLNDRKLTRKTRTWIIDRIMASGQVHMICGPSGTGKSSWFLPMIKDWSEGKDVLGYKSYPAPYLYISCDRSFDELDQTLCRLGLDEWDIHAICIEELESKYGLSHGQAQLEDLPILFPWARVFFIEAIGWFTPGAGAQRGNSYQDVMRYWSDVRVHFASQDLSIVGTTHSPKSKPGENYAGRDKIIGSSGQPAVYSTIITFDFEDQRDPKNPGRLITVYPRNEPNMVLKYNLDDRGRLVLAGEVEQASIEQEKNVTAILLEMQQAGLKKGDLITMETVQGWRMRLNISRQTSARLLKLFCDVGIMKLINKHRGTYRLEKDLTNLGSLTSIQ